MSPLDKNLLRCNVWWAHAPAWHPSCKPHLIADESYPSQCSADRRELWAGFLVPSRGYSRSIVFLLKVVFPHSTVSGIMNSVRMEMSICYVGGRPTSWSMAFSVISFKTNKIKIKRKKIQVLYSPCDESNKMDSEKAISHNLIMIFITLALLLILKIY